MNRREFIALAGAGSLAPASRLRAHTAPHDALIEAVVAAAKAVAKRDRRRRLRLLHPPGCEANLRPVINRFTQLTEVEVALQQSSLDDIGQEIRLLDRSGEASLDLALPPSFNLPDLADDGLLQELTAFAAHYEPALLREQELHTGTDKVDGRFFGYQTDGDAYLLFINPALPHYERLSAEYSDRHGTALAAPRTWAELDRQLRHFHRPALNTIGGALYRNRRYIVWEFWSRLHGAGAYPVDADFEPQFNGPAGEQALSELVRATDSLTPRVASLGLFENWDAFNLGNTYLNLGWGGAQKAFDRPTSMVRHRLSHGLLPGGAGADGQPFPTPMFNWGWNYVVPRTSAAPELAYLYSLFASLPPLSTLSVAQPSGYFDPHQHSHYSDPGIAAIYGESFLAAHRRSMALAMPDFRVAMQSRYQRALSEAIYAADRGFIPPKRALDAAASKWRELNERAGQAQQRLRWGRLLAHYPVHLRRQLG